MTVYYDRSQVQSPGFPSMLAIGDSWFWYPVVSNLLAEISAIVRPEYSNILALGKLGATLESFATGAFADAFARELRPRNAQYYSAILISGAGNDAVDWRFALLGDCSASTAADACFDRARLAELMDRLAGWMLALIGEVHLAFDAAGLRRPDIFLHTYDYAPPNGRGAAFPLFGIPLSGPWIKPAMDAARVPDDAALRRAIVRTLIDELQRTFATFDAPADGVHVIQTAGTLDPDVDWANELHPNGTGFRKLVRGPWLRRLREFNYVV
jgi:hypothetical protein